MNTFDGHPQALPIHFAGSDMLTPTSAPSLHASIFWSDLLSLSSVHACAPLRDP